MNQNAEIQFWMFQNNWSFYSDFLLSLIFIDSNRNRIGKSDVDESTMTNKFRSNELCILINAVDNIH